MKSGHSARRWLVVGAAVALCALLAAGLVWAAAGEVAIVRSPGPAPVDALLAVSATIGAVASLSWIAACMVLTAMASLPRFAGTAIDRLAGRVTPAVVRRTTAGLLGVAISCAPLASATTALAATHASPSATAFAARRGATGLSIDRPAPDTLPSLDRPSAAAVSPVRSAEQAGSVLASWTPDRPAAPPKPQVAARSLHLVAPAPHRAHAIADDVVVRRGDSLWTIAARHLGPDASAAEVAAEWPRWYAANRDAIGADPHLLHAGQRLHSPAAS
jgi:nucleoid-associated protein YgaU